MDAAAEDRIEDRLADQFEEQASLQQSSKGKAKGGKSGKGGGGGGGGRGGAPADSAAKKQKDISRALSRLLRHQALNAGIKLDKEGYAPLDKVVSSLPYFFFFGLLGEVLLWEERPARLSSHAWCVCVWWPWPCVESETRQVKSSHPRLRVLATLGHRVPLLACFL